jgi:uncharacterized protein
MVDFTKITGFNWDKANLEKSKNKHRVEAYECEEIYFNQPLLLSRDAKHSVAEKRYYALGITDQERKLFVVFTIRKNLIRIISARDMSRRERKIYE